jgi:hypothetical protein
MKSMETYYRWLAIQYAAQRGRIHSELVETLFRYNARPRMGRFVARLEALCRRAPVDGGCSAPTDVDDDSGRARAGLVGERELRLDTSNI